MKNVRSIYKEFVVLSPEKSVSIESLDSGLYSRLDANYNNFKGHALISSYEFDEDWSNWEMHPNGDEIVILLSGSVTFVLRHREGEEFIDLESSGEYCVVPKGVWHTAKTRKKSRVLFVTPGEGTIHESR
jgi:mannose-6-phosphate isomerase-like protein (cupin superfamily)